MTVPRITLLGRPGCHLCDDARAVISKVADDLGVAWEERDITQSAADLREYWEKIPVTLRGRRAARLLASLRGPPPPGVAVILT